MNDDQFTKLFSAIEGLGNQFEGLDDRLGKTDAAIAGIDNRLSRTESAIAAVADGIAAVRDDVHVGFDQIASRLDDDDIERVALMAQTDRHEGWIKQLADKTGTDLVVEA